MCVRSHGVREDGCLVLLCFFSLLLVFGFGIWGGRGAPMKVTCDYVSEM